MSGSSFRCSRGCGWRQVGSTRDLSVMQQQVASQRQASVALKHISYVLYYVTIIYCLIFWSGLSGTRYNDWLPALSPDSSGFFSPVHTRDSPCSPTNFLRESSEWVEEDEQGAGGVSRSGGGVGGGHAGGAKDVIVAQLSIQSLTQNLSVDSLASARTLHSLREVSTPWRYRQRRGALKDVC